MQGWRGKLLAPVGAHGRDDESVSIRPPACVAGTVARVALAAVRVMAGRAPLLRARRVTTTSAGQPANRWTRPLAQRSRATALFRRRALAVAAAPAGARAGAAVAARAALGILRGTAAARAGTTTVRLVLGGLAHVILSGPLRRAPLRAFTPQDAAPPRPLQGPGRADRVPRGARLAMALGRASLSVPNARSSTRATMRGARAVGAPRDRL